MSATRYIVQVNGTPLITRSRKEQAMPVYEAEASNKENVVVLITNTGKVLESNQAHITTEAPVLELKVEASAPILETLAPVTAALEEFTAEEPKAPVTAPETTDDALEFLKAEVEATNAKRAEMTERSKEVPEEQVEEMVALTKRPKISNIYTIRVAELEPIHVAGTKAKADKEFELQVKAHRAAKITMTSPKGNQVRYYDGALVVTKEINDANPTAPLVGAPRPSRKKVADKPAETPKAPARKPAAKKSPAAPKKVAAPVKVDGRKTPAAPRYRPAPGTVRDQVIEFLNRKENINKSFTSVQIMHALGRDNGVNNISTALADRGQIAWASKPQEVKHFTSNKSTRLLKKLGLLDAARARQTGVTTVDLVAAAKKVAAPHIEADRRAGRKIKTGK